MAASAQNARERRANAKFWPPDSASLSNTWVAFCILWQIISFFSNIGIVVIIIYLWKQCDDAYTSPTVNSYPGNNLAKFGGSPRDGYLPESNLPKQLLSMGFISMFYLGLLVMVFILGIIDLCLLSPFARGAARMMKVSGLNLSEHSEQQSIIAVAFLKLWVGVCVGSQSFIAFGEGNGRPQQVSEPETWHGRFIVTLFVWAFCLNGLIYIATTFTIARRLQVKQKMIKEEDRGGFFFTHREKEGMDGRARSKAYEFHKAG